MKLKTIFTVNYIIAFLFGAGFTFFPTLCSSLMGFNVAGDSSLIARGMGVFVIGTGVLTFFARDASKSEARRAIVLSLFTLYILLILYKVSLNLLLTTYIYSTKYRNIFHTSLFPEQTVELSGGIFLPSA